MTTNKNLNGSLTSLIIGGPIGLISMFFGLLLPASLFGEGFTLMMAAPLLIYPVLSLILSFLVILWFAGRYAADNLAKGQTLLWVSIKYSVTVNLVIWTIFYLVLMFITQGGGAEIFLYLPLFFAILGIVIAPLTIGLFICYMIKQKITNANLGNHNLPDKSESQTDPEGETDDTQLTVKRFTYDCNEGELMIEQKLEFPSSDDLAFLNGRPAPSGKYIIGEKQFVFVSNGNIYAVRGFADNKT